MPNLHSKVVTSSSITDTGAAKPGIATIYGASSASSTSPTSGSFAEICATQLSISDEDQPSAEGSSPILDASQIPNSDGRATKTRAAKLAEDSDKDSSDAPSVLLSPFAVIALMAPLPTLPVTADQSAPESLSQLGNSSGGLQVQIPIEQTIQASATQEATPNPDSNWNSPTDPTATEGSLDASKCESELSKAVLLALDSSVEMVSTALTAKSSEVETTSVRTTTVASGSSETSPPRTDVGKTTAKLITSDPNELSRNSAPSMDAADPRNEQPQQAPLQSAPVSYTLAQERVEVAPEQSLAAIQEHAANQIHIPSNHKGASRGSENRPLDQTGEKDSVVLTGSPVEPRKQSAPPTFDRETAAKRSFTTIRPKIALTELLSSNAAINTASADAPSAVPQRIEVQQRQAAISSILASTPAVSEVGGQDSRTGSSRDGTGVTAAEDREYDALPATSSERQSEGSDHRTERDTVSPGSNQVSASVSPSLLVTPAHAAKAENPVNLTGANPNSNDQNVSEAAYAHAMKESSDPLAAGPVQLARMLRSVEQLEMRVGLNTDAFGAVQVRTVVHASDVGVQIGSEKGDLRSLLANDIPGIAHSLQQQDLRLTQVSFQQNGFSFTGDPSQHQSQSRPFNHRQAYTAGSAVDSPTIETQLLAGVQETARNGLSILA